MDDGIATYAELLLQQSRDALSAQYVNACLCCGYMLMLVAGHGLKQQTFAPSRCSL